MKVNQIISLSIALSASILTTACGDNPSAPKSTPKAEAPSSSNANTVSELIKTDVKVGEGAEAKSGQTVAVHYTGWLYDAGAADKHGAKFDSSRDRGTAFEFPLGAGRVIKGWDQGVVGMKVGGQRTLIIPPNMAYGSRSVGGVIPANSTLIF